MLDVSENTVRRDLERLEKMGILKRTHGGAVLLEEARDIDDLDWLSRQNKMVKEKERIGLSAAELIQDGEAIILDAGTTTIQVAKKIQNKHNITVCTNAVNIAIELLFNKSITIILTGGILREISQSLVGSLAEDFLNGSIHVDKMFLSAGGISAERGVTNANIIEVPIKRAMINAAKEVILVVTHDKVGKISFTQVIPTEKIDIIITDKCDDNSVVEELQRIKSKGVEIIQV
jgi:DeoR family fructose operon transcriptional repressor